MNSITHTINGLASSLFLSVGLTQVAQKLDPVTRTKPQTMTTAISAEFSTGGGPCEFTMDKGI
jgi:hypothetical protein